MRSTPARVAVLIALAGLAALASGAAPSPEPPGPVVQKIEAEARALAPLITSPVGRAFLAATTNLPNPPARVVYRDTERRAYLPPRLVADPASAHIERVEIDAESYYYTKYGSPLAFVRTLDLLAGSGLESIEGRRVLDFGYGTVGHLRLMAQLGAEAVGVDVDSFLPALYAEPGDAGAVSRPGATPGCVTMIDGFWPLHAGTRIAVGGGYDLFISKNTLKRGYVHPEREVDPRRLVHLGVDDETYVRAMHTALVPGGYAIIYNLCPAPGGPDEPYRPWTDGRCPFDRVLLESVGFEVLAYDADDSGFARAMGRALGWDTGERPMDLEKDLFGTYTVLRRLPD